MDLRKHKTLIKRKRVNKAHDRVEIKNRTKFASCARLVNGANRYEDAGMHSHALLLFLFSCRKLSRSEETEVSG